MNFGQNLYTWFLSNAQSPVSYTHLDVYKRQVRYRKQSVSPVILLSIVLHSEPYPQSVKCEVF